ncbi:hypothetical protein KJ665_01700 [Patescibacteria group bacterium]|nr:hypothetical protein [Patescibacteria group bacterium]
MDEKRKRNGGSHNRSAESGEKRDFVPCSLGELESIEARDAGHGPCLPGTSVKELSEAFEKYNPGGSKALALMDEYAKPVKEE